MAGTRFMTTAVAASSTLKVCLNTCIHIWLCRLVINIRLQKMRPLGYCDMSGPVATPALCLQGFWQSAWVLCTRRGRRRITQPLLIACTKWPGLPTAQPRRGVREQTTPAPAQRSGCGVAGPLGTQRPRWLFSSK
jgi:hypothetical protein